MRIRGRLATVGYCPDVWKKWEQKALRNRIRWSNVKEDAVGIVKCHFEIGAGKENFEWS